MSEKKEKKPEVIEKAPDKKPPELKSEAPDGFRELKPGRSLCFGSKTFAAGKVILIGDKWERTILKNRFVPETVIKMLKADDSLFL